MSRENELRIEREKRIVRSLIAGLDQAGFKLVSVWDGEEYVQCATAEQAVEAVFAVDDTPTIHFAPAGQPEAWGKLGVLVVPGNGEDLISDYHCGNEAFAKAMDAVCAVIEATR